MQGWLHEVLQRTTVSLTQILIIQNLVNYTCLLKSVSTTTSLSRSSLKRRRSSVYKRSSRSTFPCTTSYQSRASMMIWCSTLSSESISLTDFRRGGKWTGLTSSTSWWHWVQSTLLTWFSTLKSRDTQQPLKLMQGSRWRLPLHGGPT